MSTKILSQVIDYDNTARAWGRYALDASLIKYHDSQGEAIRAALPPDLRAWAETHAGNRRLLRAAVLLAEEMVTPDPEAPAVYHVRSQSALYEKFYTANAHAKTCTCPDFEHGHLCKHLYAASRLWQQFQAEVRQYEAEAKPPLSLWDLARAAVEEHRYHADIKHLIIWQAGTRYAALQRIDTQSTASRIAPSTDLYLTVSSHPRTLCVASLRPALLEHEWWAWTCDHDQYDAWCQELQK